MGRGADPAALSVRPLAEADLAWAEAWVRAELGGRRQVRRGEEVDAPEPPGLVAEQDGRSVGLVTAAPRDDGWELVLLVAVERRSGVATALVRRVLDEAARARARQVWVVTTNDNLGALALYPRLGFRLSALRPGAVDEARATRKPEIPATGEEGLPLRDELELAIDV